MGDLGANHIRDKNGVPFVPYYILGGGFNIALNVLPLFGENDPNLII